MAEAASATQWVGAWPRPRMTVSRVARSILSATSPIDARPLETVRQARALLPFHPRCCGRATPRPGVAPCLDATDPPTRRFTPLPGGTYDQVEQTPLWGRAGCCNERLDSQPTRGPNGDRHRPNSLLRLQREL